MSARRSVLLMLLALVWAAPLSAQPPAGVIEYYHVDALGSGRAVTNASGGTVRTHHYHPFGEGVGVDTTTDPIRFTSKPRDGETGLDYFGARYYAPRAARFSSVDPVLNASAALTNPQRWNRYSYGGNNPLRYVDPDGADFRDFVNGLSDALRANFVLGAGRGNGGNGDYQTGQVVGDLVALAMGAYEFTVGAAAASGGAALCGTGIGCVAGAPVAAGGAIVAGHGVGMSVAASSSLMSRASGNESGGLGGFRKANSRDLNGVDEHAAKEDLVGRDGKKYNISVDKDGLVVLTPVRKGEESVRTGLTLDQLRTQYPKK